ncbi:diguanylate cyclase [Pseudoalteromonas aliena]|uniref:GGDEF domain-containing protein n=1 Tax=Pseudoalteromonas aliena TaxID=247523 RepID=UPI00311D33DA
MRFNPFTSHRLLINAIIAMFFSAIFLSSYLGVLKTYDSIQWLDIMGEGGIVLMTLIWIAALLISRPPSKVTTYLVIGVGLFMFSATLDLFDEWLMHPAHQWLSWIESLPAPLGMLLTSVGLYYWHQEQYVLNSQLRRREAHLREHGKVCPTTGLYKAQYLDSVIKEQLMSKQTLWLGAIDIRDFSHFNSEFGFREGDRLLREISELLLMNCRLSDVVCRYAGDCFMVLMPATTEQQAKELMAQIKGALKHCAFKVEASKKAKFQYVTIALIQGNTHSGTGKLTSQLHSQLQQKKHQQKVAHRAHVC